MPATVDRRGFLKGAALLLGALAAGLQGAFDGLWDGVLPGHKAAQAGAGPTPKIQPPLHSVSRRP
jgi:hypothetical protein